MDHSEPTTEVDAIRNVIRDGVAGDFVDVVREVERRYRMKVTSAQVEDVYHQLMTEQPVERQQARVQVEVASTPETLGSSEPPTAESPSDDALAQALQFVKSVGGIGNAKKALAELEAMLSK